MASAPIAEVSQSIKAMSTARFANLQPETIFAPFKDALGLHFARVCDLAKCQLGRWEKDVKSTAGVWKCSDKGILSSKEGHKLQLPLNNPLSILIRFGVQLSDIASKGDFDGVYTLNDKTGVVAHCGMQVGIPRTCEDWFQQLAKSAKTVEELVVE